MPPWRVYLFSSISYVCEGNAREMPKVWDRRKLTKLNALAGFYGHTKLTKEETDFFGPHASSTWDFREDKKRAKGEVP